MVARSPGLGMLALIQTAAALSALMMTPTLERFPALFARALAISSEPAVVLTVQVTLSLLAMLGPTLLLGASFPCAVAALGSGLDRVGRDTGRLYAASTAGAIAGAMAVGLALIPRLGVQASIKIGVALNVLAAVVAIIFGLRHIRARLRVAGIALGSVVLVVASLLPPWSPAVMSSGVAVYGHEWGRLMDKVSVADLVRTRRLLFYEEGPTATVTVHASSHLVLKANGKTEASTGPDMHTQLMAGHLPLLVHPAPRRALVIGLGSGVTVAAVARHPVERIDVVEIEPAITRAARLFARENRDVLEDPRVRITIADARSVLLSQPDRYDVIISEPSNPWISGVAMLFTREFYALARERLRPDGRMVQWVQGYSMAPADLRMMVRSFQTAFPATTIWSASNGDYLLLGAARPEPFPTERVLARHDGVPGVREDFQRAGLPVAVALYADFLLDETGAERYAAGAPINTDDLLPLEFSAPRSLYRDTTDENWRLLRAAGRVELPSGLDSAGARHAMGTAFLSKGLPAEAMREFDRALAHDPGHAPTLIERGRLFLSTKAPGEAQAAFAQALRHRPNDPELHYLLGAAQQATSGAGSALAAYRRAVELAPERVDFMRAYATALLQEGRASEALSYLLLARAFRPRDPALMDLAGFVYLQVGNAARAVELLQQAVAVAPAEAIYYFRLAQAQMSAGNSGAAIAGFQKAAELRPDFLEAHLELANTYFVTNQVQPAVQAYRQVLALDPANPMALRVLSSLTR
jgi:spermidine synthase